MTSDPSPSNLNGPTVEPSTQASSASNAQVGLSYGARRYVRFATISYILLLSVMFGFMVYGLVSIATMPSGQGLVVPGSLLLVLAVCMITVFIVSISLLVGSIVYLAGDAAAGGSKILAIISTFLMSILVLAGAGYIIQLFSY